MSDQSSKTVAGHWRLANLAIKDLFGKYSFEKIDLSHSTESGVGLTLIYGDNGVGKTTILKLIYSAISSERNAGNRGYIASVPFRSLKLSFGNDQEISIRREGKSLKGDYIYEFTGPNVNRRFDISPDYDGKVGLNKNPEISELTEILQEMFPPIIFLNDHRTLRTSQATPSPRSYRQVNDDFLDMSTRLYSEYRVGRNSELTLENLSYTSLDNLLTRAQILFSSRALKGTARANEGSGQVYLNAAQAIARTVKGGNDDVDAPNADDLIRRIGKLIPKIEQFSKVGLNEGERLGELGRLLDKAKGEKRTQLALLIAPYLASTENRIEKNEQIATLANTYQDNVNNFFKRKRVQVKIGENIIISDDDGNQITSSQISSGERQVLSLCTVALLSSQENSIILIDEPELSLNFKWQRQLVESLIEIAGSSSQFLMASHSFEIISNHRDCLELIEPA